MSELKGRAAMRRYVDHAVPQSTASTGQNAGMDSGPDTVAFAPPPVEELNRTEGIPPGGWVTSEVARAHVQELRHQNDALLVGAGTILSDNPLLTDRSGRRRRRPLLRVILDSRLRLPLDSRLVKNAAAERKNDVLVFCSSADAQKKEQLEQMGIRIENVPAVVPDGRPDLPTILKRLGEMEIKGDNILLGQPFIFNKENVEQFNF